LLTDALGIVFEVFEAERDAKFWLIVDYRYALLRPDSIRFLQEPWSSVGAFDVSGKTEQQSVEVMQFDTHQEREQVFTQLLHLLETYPGGGTDHGTDGEENPAPVPVNPVPPRLSAGDAQQLPE